MGLSGAKDAEPCGFISFLLRKYSSGLEGRSQPKTMDNSVMSFSPRGFSCDFTPGYLYCVISCGSLPISVYSGQSRTLHYPIPSVSRANHNADDIADELCPGHHII